MVKPLVSIENIRKWYLKYLLFRALYKMAIPERTKKFLVNQDVRTLMYQIKLGRKKIADGNASVYDEEVVAYMRDIVHVKVNKTKEEFGDDDLGVFLFNAYINALQG